MCYAGDNGRSAADAGMDEAIGFNHNAGAGASMAEGRELSPTLRSCPKSGGNEPAVVKLRHTGSPNAGGGEGAMVGEGCSYTLATAQDQTLFEPKGAGCVVRRLTPVECERLQGFPDDHTLVPYRGRPAEECPDGPRYKALGNSMAVPVMRWIGERMQEVEGL